ncbi:hypothetical protein D0U04_00415 [Bacillus clarus]|uniref:Uncharacterized protein n=1 Tax=Bacillus clarus TaxID=2338372 RepID=A0A090YY40_9BACI|nr:hypothetical protein DJ93_863 [Bacillus clarus]RFT68680.1 hypothetical protein D0U04_00415 [Bacillus clarus]
MGVVTTSVAFFFLRKEFHTGLPIQKSTPSTESSKTLTSLSPRVKRWLAICIPIVYAIDILCTIQFQLQGSDATALIGGGTLIPWALIPSAAIDKVDPFELVRRNFLPVIIGLIVTTIVAMFIL